MLTLVVDQQDAPLLARSASVREPTKTNPVNMSPVGGLSHQGKLDPELPAEKTKGARDPKRRTVQVEYVAPQSQTTRGEVTPSTMSPSAAIAAPINGGGPSKSRVRDSTEATNALQGKPSTTTTSKALPQDPYTVDNARSERTYYTQHGSANPQQRTSASQQPMPPPARPPKDLPRSVSDSTSAFAPLTTSTTGRPATSGSMASGAGRLPSRGNSYSQPLAPTVAATNAQGRLAQPKNGKQYNISNPIPQSEPYYPEQSGGRPSAQQYAPASTPPQQREHARGHKRSNTLGNLLGRSGSVFGGRSQSQSQQSQEQKQSQERRYPPTSMKSPVATDSPRQSTDSRRPSFSFGRKNSDFRKNNDVPKQEKPRRFSLLPASFSLKNLTGGTKEQSLTSPIPTSDQRPSTTQQVAQSRGQSRPQTMAYSQGQSRSNSYRHEDSIPTGYDGQKDSQRDNAPLQTRRNNESHRKGNQLQARQYDDLSYSSQQEAPSPLRPPHGQSYLLGGSGTPTDSEISLGAGQRRPVYPPGFDSNDNFSRPSIQQNRGPRGPTVLAKNNRKFVDAYEQDQEPGYGSGGNHAGSSGAAKRVMDFFRRRGKARAGDERV